MANNTSSAFDRMPTPKLHVVINIISLSATTFGTLISFIILVGFLLRRKTFRDVPLLLCTNTYAIVFVVGMLEFIHNLNTFQGDFNLRIINQNISICRIEAYIEFSLLSAVYLACVLQVSLQL